MNLSKSDKPVIIFLSTFPPRECGIATFTQDLASAFDQLFSATIETKIIAMNADAFSRHTYGKKVIFEITETDSQSYIEAAQRLNRLNHVKLVNIQHEFGIFGGEYGSYLIKFLEEIKKPVFTTLHTVLPKPTKKLWEVVRKIQNLSHKIIVFNLLSRTILMKEYQIDAKKISVIPHGIHPQPYRTSDKVKASLGYRGKIVLSTFGLLNQGKGIEYVLQSLPEIIQKNSNIVYLIIGATHPMVLRKEGEAYRNSLVKKVFDLKLNYNVAFYNRYLSTPELLKFLEGTDIYLAPSLDPNQASSGSLSYALGTGRPVISTPFIQARENITEQTGFLVPFRDSRAITKALEKLIGDRKLILEMSRNAYLQTRIMIWPNVALAYGRRFSEFLPEFSGGDKTVFPIKLTHLIHMTDDFGMFQFARLTEPDRSFGYTVDDNARALVACVLYYHKTKRSQVVKLISIYLNFLEYTQGPGCFQNYVYPNKDIDRKSNKKVNLEDSTARALYALAVTGNISSVPFAQREKAKEIFQKSFEKGARFTSPRSAAFYIMALHQFLLRNQDKKKEKALGTHCEDLTSAFHRNSKATWKWFEDRLAYSNASIPQALVLAYEITKKQEYLDVALQAFDFLIEKTFVNGKYVPIGQDGWYEQGKKRHFFDQQPEDVSAMVQALKDFYRITKKPHYQSLMYQAFRWFYGHNTLGQIVYDPTSGGCYDGVRKKGVNLNQGAESTVSYLLARLSL